MAAEGDIIRGIFAGEEQPVAVEHQYGGVRSIILPNITHLSICQSLTFIPQFAFYYHPDIIELNCHKNVKRIEGRAFTKCISLKRLIMPGVEEVEIDAFGDCEAVEHLECDKLKTIRLYAFSSCVSLSSIDLPSVESVEGGAFIDCEALRDVKFGKSLDTLEAEAFCICPSLERITIPLKEGLIGHDSVFTECGKLKRVDLVEDIVLLETMAALLLDEWRQDMRNVIDSINHILPNTPAGTRHLNVGGKARAIREWIALVLHKIAHYKAEHRHLLNEAATVLQLDLPNDIVHNNVLAFLELPSHTFCGEENNSMVLS